MDVINGKVTKIIDYSTIEINVTEIGVQNQINYMSRERIKLKAINDEEVQVPNVPWPKNLLEEILLGKNIRCEVSHRDYFSRLVSEIKIIQFKMLNSGIYN